MAQNAPDTALLVIEAFLKHQIKVNFNLYNQFK